MRVFKSIALLLAVIMLCLPLAACGEDYKDAYIYIDFDTVPTNLDPQLADSDEELTVVRSLFDTLLRYDSEGKIVPSGAVSYEQKGNIYTFYLKKDAKWIDGTNVTAHDYQYALLRGVDPKTKAPFASSLFSISGAQDIYSGKKGPNALGVTVIDDYTLKIELCRNDSEFEKVLTTAITMPCNKEYFTSCGGKYGLTIDTTPSNGSYYIRKWTTETKFLIRLAKNLDYTGEFEANSMRIYFTCGDDEALPMLDNDNTDLLYASTSEYDTLKQAGYDSLAVENTCYALFINQKIDADIRKALFQTVNYKSFADALSSTQRTAHTLYPDVLSLSGVATADEVIKYDPNNSAEIYHNKALKDSPLSGMTIKYPSDGISVSVAKAIAAHWQQTLSCFINIEESALNSITASYYGNYYDIIIIPFFAVSGLVTAYNANLGYDNYDANAVSLQLYKDYRCYPLYYSTVNIFAGHKIQNLDAAVHDGIIDVAILIKKQ